MLVESNSSDLMFTGKVAGVPANWLVRSMERVGLDPRNLPVPEGKGMRHDHLPEGVRPWKNLWSAGQGIDLIHDIPSVGELVERLRGEYRAARSEEHTSELQSLMRLSYAVFCLK